LVESQRIDACLDELRVVGDGQGVNLDAQRGNEGAKLARDLRQVLDGNPLWVFARDQQDVLEALVRERPHFADGFGDGQASSGDLVAAVEAAVETAVHAVVGDIERRVELDGSTKALSGQERGLSGHVL
jgi:hypothetical protein